MRLLVLNHEYPPAGGGAAVATARLAEALAARGHRVEALTGALPGSPDEEEVGGVLVRRLRTGRREAHQGGLVEMARYIRAVTCEARRYGASGGPDAMIAFFGLPGGEAARRLGRATRIPYLVSLRGSDVPGHRSGGLPFRSLRAVLTPAIRRVWRDAAAVVAVSPQLADLARDRARGLTVEVVPNGIDLERFVPRLHGGPGPVRIAWVGRLAAAKGADLFLDALAKVPADAPPWEAVLAGDGPLRGSLERRAQAAGIANRVRFAGWLPRPRLATLLSGCDIAALTSRDEGMPGAVLEAFAAGLPVVAGEIPAVRDLVRDGVNGLVVPSGDPGATAAALMRLLADPGLRSVLGRRARRDAAGFRWDTVAAEYERLCLRAIGRSLDPAMPPADRLILSGSS